jgi:F0F1-type ATP synthase assembly protein I
MSWWVVALRLTGLGWYIAFCVVAGIVVGILLDKATGLSPLFAIIGVILGSIIAFWGVYKMILPVLYGFRNPNTADRGRDE